MSDGPGGQWISRSLISEAATLTVCTGLTRVQVLDAFSAQHESEPMGEIINEFSIDPWVAVADLGGGTVLAFEDNGWQGSAGPTLRRVSAAGRAASVFWNVNAVQALSFAEHGRVLSSTTDYGWRPIETGGNRVVAETVAGLDFSDWKTQREQALVAAAWFTGRLIERADVEAILNADRAHRILPWRDDHYPSSAGGDLRARRDLAATMLGEHLAEVGALPDADLRGLAWDLAERVCRETGLLADDPAAGESIARRELTPQAELGARASTLSSGAHVVGWAVLHEATNPDAFNAVLQVRSHARYALPVTDELLRRAVEVHGTT
ncbi:MULTISPECIES: DUF6461 domain-containing protein [Pseudonocardia]|uniref:Uncharacterized protein n=2 Tax=Pseudonocardia TaxID=1847 RepID=A0A1Y2MNP8_PSEAH|nr:MULTISPECIES: DUF6461 domain-containing protein [Pseudonocardia]OSY36873.1 hypothetical protein BG845_05146 [Pseudonocardia autotrophica]TDN76863.1 hypothetical protein C8E95_6083 [Pseudonocardia autotrophica]BBG00865.1 hypothetical protein Pdca_20740 [Pseudonocardia autotrophica]GEC28868.1 hypothetical protein PSA01_58970 [Pseudonocardia saturnea]